MCATLSSEMSPEFALLNARTSGRLANTEVLQYLREEGHADTTGSVLETATPVRSFARGIALRLASGVRQGFGHGRSRRPPSGPSDGPLFDPFDTSPGASMRYPNPPVIFP